MKTVSVNDIMMYRRERNVSLKFDQNKVDVSIGSFQGNFDSHHTNISNITNVFLKHKLQLGTVLFQRFKKTSWLKQMD